MTKKTIMWLAAVLAALIACGAAVSAQPGDNSDPVVTKSYIDKVVEEIKAYVSETVQSAFSGNTDSEASDAADTSGSYKVVNISRGKKISFGEGTEFILRAGSGTIFSSEQGGIADTTDGKDLAGGERVPANHLLIVPRADGRGFTTESDAVIMVRGSYEIE